MKFSSREEYGLRCLMRIGKFYRVKKGLTIPEISRSEGLSQHNTAKLLRNLRLGGFLTSARGQTGGYTLAKPPEEIIIGDVLTSLGGKLYDNEFCNTHSGINNICINSIDCSIRSLWTLIQKSIDNVVNNMTLGDLLDDENELFEKFPSQSQADSGAPDRRNKFIQVQI